MQLSRYKQVVAFYLCLAGAATPGDASTASNSNNLTSSVNVSHTYQPTSTSSSTLGVGDFVASGLGLQDGSTTSTSTRLGVTNTSSSAPSTPAYNTTAFSYSPSASGSGVHGSLTTSSTRANYTTSLNDTFNLTGPQSSCQASWNSYYATLEAWLMAENISTSFVLTTETLTSTSYATLETTFTVTTAQVESIVSYSYDYITVSGSTATTYVPTSDILSTVTFETWTTILGDVIPTASPVTPACQAPIGTEQCNSAWGVWSTAAGQPDYWWWAPFIEAEDQSTPTVPLTPPPTPNCVQAPIPTSSCDDLQSQIVWPLGPFEPIEYLPAVALSNQGTNWPSTYSLAPGCTLGCGKCTLTGGSAELLYWPSTSNGSNITITGTGVGTPATTTLDGYTLTSPTLYLSFNNIWASNWCNSVGSNYTNEIVPVATNHLSILELADLQAILTPAPFDVSSWSELESSGISSYLLSIPPEIDGIDPAWSNCVGLSAGVWDPPKALQPASTVAGVSTPPGHQTTSSEASPAPTVLPSTPTATGTASAASDQLPSSTQQPVASDGPSGDGISPSAASPTGATDPVGGNGPVSTPISDATSSPNPSDTAASPSDNNASPSANNGDPTTVSAADPNALSVLSSAENSFTSFEASVSNDPSAGNGASTAQTQGDPGTSDAQPTGDSGAIQGPGSTADTVGTQAVSQVLSSQPQATVITAGSGVYTVGPAAGVSAGQVSPAVVVSNAGSAVTLHAGAAATTLNGQQVSLPSDGGIVIGSGASATTAAAVIGVGQGSSTAVLSVGGQVLTATQQVVNGQTEAVINGQTLTQGGAAVTTNGVAVSFGASGIVPGTSFAPFVAPAVTGIVTIGTGHQPLPVTQEVVNGQTALIVGSATLSAGGAATTINGVTVSAGSSGLVEAGPLGTATLPYASLGSATAAGLNAVITAAVFTVSGTAYTASEVSSGIYVLDGTTFSAGGAALTLPGESDIVSAGATDIVVDGSTIAVQKITQASSGGDETVLLTASSGQTITAVEAPGASAAVIDGSITLSVGGPGAVVDGQSLSLASSGLVAQGSTVAFTHAENSAGVTTAGGALETTRVTGSLGASAATFTGSATRSRSQCAVLSGLVAPMLLAITVLLR